MILELAGHGPDLIQVTAQYSNAVLVALLPYFSDVGQKLDLPVPHPITMQNVVHSGIDPYRYPNGDMLGAGIEVQGGWIFGFKWGYVNVVESKHSYFTLQNPDEVPKFFGTVRMTKNEAIQMARDTIKKMGIPLEAVFAEQEPRVAPLERVGTNTVPRYRIEWLDPRADTHAVDIEINADAKRVERIYLRLNENLHRPPPKIDVPTPLARTRPHVNVEYAWKLLPIVLRAVDDYGKTLGLPIPRPLTTNQVARFEVGDNGGWPHSELELTNGWRFIYRNSMVNGFYSPDNFFDSDRRAILIKDFVGKTNMTEEQGIALVRRMLAKLNYPTNLIHMDFKPKVLKPTVRGIPRYEFWWNFENETHDDLISKVGAEVDEDKGELKSLYFDNKAFWNHPPPIDVPISLPVSRQPNNSNSAPLGTSSKPPPRSFTPLNAPKER